MAESYFDLKEITEVWLRCKWGKFSSSEIELLNDKGNGKMFGKGAATYIKRVARQECSVFNTDEGIETAAMRMGKIKEGELFGFYKKMIGLNALVHHGDINPLFHEYLPGVGSSPDCLARTESGVVSFGAEFKNPKSDTHFSYLFEINDQWDLLKTEPKYYSQCQHAMLAFNADLWHFVSFNEYFKSMSQKMLIVEVKKDQRFCDNLEIRIASAIKIKNKIVEMLNNGYKGIIDINSI